MTGRAAARTGALRGGGVRRVLVTGSRSWDDRQTIREALDAIGFEHGFQGLVIVHGHCPDGADAIADEWALYNRVLGVRVERHPADWTTCGPTCRPGHLRTRPDGTGYCRSAGFRRNAEMVAAGAHLALAFIRGGSRGATHCADLAEKAGIPTKRFTA